ncbi:MAG: hypothetical protein ACTSVU_06210 [Promethearchaeota archaeon]
MKIDITKIEDEMEGNWWEYLRLSNDFGYQTKIPHHHSAEIENDDILIHKAKDTNEDTGFSFIAHNYFQILDGEAYEIKAADVRELIAGKIIAFIKKNKKLPHDIHFKKGFKNGKVMLTFRMTDYDSMNVKFDMKELEISHEGKNIEIEEMEEYFKNLPVEEKNPLAEKNSETTNKIHKMVSVPVFEEIAGETGGKIFVNDAKILEIDKRKSVFQEHETIFYLIHLKGGTAANSGKKDALIREFSEVNAKSSEMAMEKFKLKVGDVISFTGQLKKNRKLGYVIQNIRKFTKQIEDENSEIDKEKPAKKITTKKKSTKKKPPKK